MSRCKLKLWKYHVLKHNKFSFIHDQFTRMYSDIFMFCKSFRSYFDNVKNETSDKAKYLLLL